MFTNDFGTAADAIFVGGSGLLLADLLRNGMIR
jgi:hypothetical protein